MQLLSIQIPETYIAGIDMLVLYGYFPNRSEAIRAGIRDLIEKELGSFKDLKNYTNFMVQSPKVNGSDNEEINNL